MIRAIKLGLAPVALVAFGSLFLAAPASAQDFSGSCAAYNAATPPFVNVTITDSTCVLTVNVAGSGAVSITATSVSGLDVSAGSTLAISAGSLTSGDLTAGSTVVINGSPTTVDTGDVSGTDISITSSGTIDTGSLTASAGNVALTSTGSIATDAISSSEYTNINAMGDSGTVDVTGTIDAADDYVTINAGSTITISDTVTTATSGDITLSAMGAITTHELDSAWDVNVQSATGSGGDTQITGDVTANDGYVYVSSDGLINITGTTASVEYGHIQLIAQSTLATGAINGASGYNIDLKANQNGGTSAFVTNPGGGPPTNGTAGAITSPGGAIYITNSTTGNAGDITVTNATDIVDTAAAGTRAIILNAQDGTLSMPTGTLAVDGDGTYAAGQIVLMSNTVDFADGAVLSAQEPMVGGSLHGISISAQNVNYGSSSGLTLDADGNGTDPGTGFIYLLTEGATTVTEYGGFPPDLYIFLYSSPYVAGSITYAGDGPLTATAEGIEDGIVVSAYPMSFSGGSLTFQSNGNADNFVEVFNYGTFTGAPGLTLSGSGDVLIDASGNGYAGGYAEIETDATEIDGNSLTVKANGPPTGDGAGGQVYIYSSGFALDEGTTATVTANAASSGTGNASATAITFYPGDVDFDLGSSAGQYTFAARGGSTSGDAGTVILGGFDSAVTVYGAGAMSTPIDVSAPGTTGNGGTINLTAYNGLTFDGDDSILTADSGSTAGNGGQILIQTSTNPVVIGTGSAGDVTLTAISNGSGNGGTVNVTSYSGITADSAYITVNGGSTGNGGNLTLNSDYSTLTLNSAEFHVDGGASGGDGGFILLEGGEIELVADENTLVTANSLSDGGNGGTVEVTTNSAYGSVDFGSDNGQVTIEANGADGTGAGGNLQVIQATSYTVNAGTSLSAIAYGNGDGGYIILQCTDTITINGTVNAQGVGTGNGGTISLEAPTIALGGSASFNADAGSAGNGNGGGIALRNGAGMTPLDLSSWTSSLFSAQGKGTGEGGQLTIESVGPFAFQTVLNVDGGSGVTSTSTPYGVVTLNGVPAGQWVTNYGSYPITYWKTVVPYTSPDLTVAGYANGLAAGVLAALSSTMPKPVQLFWMDSATEYNTFFADSIPADLGISDTNAGQQSSAVFNNVDGVSVQTVVDNTGPAIEGVTAHELGHQLDAIEGSPSLGTGAGSFGAALSTDFTTINGLACTTVLPSAACSYSLPDNSEKLLAYINNDPTFATPDEDTKELFADLFAYFSYPGTDYPLYEHAYSYLPTANSWMSTYIGSLP